mmetsp:Transcript_9010/g.21952  ORF Transcript_9010/g.21952 Transcript_9010/m.21952 type:complete len:222 (+) Transcript_9010:1067-1732(+)
MTSENSTTSSTTTNWRRWTSTTSFHKSPQQPPLNSLRTRFLHYGNSRIRALATGRPCVPSTADRNTTITTTTTTTATMATTTMATILAAATIALLPGRTVAAGNTPPLRLRPTEGTNGARILPIMRLGEEVPPSGKVTTITTIIDEASERSGRATITTSARTMVITPTTSGRAVVDSETMVSITIPKADTMMEEGATTTPASTTTTVRAPSALATTSRAQS